MKPRLLGVACCWWGERYRSRRSWPIDTSAAKLVHLIVATDAHGRGLASLLVQHADAALRSEGRCALYAHIWHNNDPSYKAFRRAGWMTVGWLLEINPLGRDQPWRLHVPLGRHRRV